MTKNEVQLYNFFLSSFRFPGVKLILPFNSKSKTRSVEFKPSPTNRTELTEHEFLMSNWKQRNEIKLSTSVLGRGRRKNRFVFPAHLTKKRTWKTFFFHFRNNIRGATKWGKCWMLNQLETHYVVCVSDRHYKHIKFLPFELTLSTNTFFTLAHDCFHSRAFIVIFNLQIEWCGECVVIIIHFLNSTKCSSRDRVRENYHISEKNRCGLTVWMIFCSLNEIVIFQTMKNWENYR